MGMIMKSYSKRCNMQRKQKAQYLFMLLRKKEKVINQLKVTLLELGMEQDRIKLSQVTSLNRKVAPAWSAVVSETVLKLARTDERIVAITPAMPVGSKLEKFQKEFPDRMIDVGIAEQHATTMAAGMATQGMKPFLAIYSTFLQRAYDQVVHDICRQNLNVFIGIDRSGLVGADGETHQGVFDIAFLRHLPNMVLMMPKDENEGQHLVYTAMQYEDGPIALRYARGNGLGVQMDEELKAIPIGTWETLKEGTQAAILTFGTTIPMAMEAAERLEQAGVSVKVVNARFIKPMDEAYLHELLGKIYRF